MPITIDGTGNITGLSAGGLPDGCVTPADLSQKLTLDTAKTATGTFVDFTGIPSWARRVTVMFDGVSTNGASSVRIQLGTSSGIEATGYNGAFTRQAAGATNAANFTSGFEPGDGGSAADVRHGAITFSTLGSNIWAAFGGYGFSNSASYTSIAGRKTLSGTLDRVRITTVNGTDAFDAGTINIMYE